MKRIFTLLFVIISICSSVKSQVNTDRVLTIGKNALYFEDYILSIQYFNQVIKAKPYLAEPYLYRAIAKFNLEDYTGSENDLTLCLERNPFLVYAYQCRGAARQNLQNYEGAILDYTKGLEFRPEDKQMLINMGIAYIQSKEYDNAEETLNRLITFHPKFTQAYLTRGSLYAEKGDSLNALADYNTSASLDKYYSPIYGQRGLLYYQMDSLQNALADFTEAIRLEPRQIGYYINRGLVRYYLNDFRGTMSDYDVVIEFDPNNLIARFNRGLLRAQLGDNNRAIEDFDVVIEFEPENYMAIYNRAILREEIGDNRGAIEDINLVLNEYPNFFAAYYFRSSIKRKMRDVTGADRDYWYAYDLENKLLKEKEQGKVVTGKAVLSADEAEVAETQDDKTRAKSDKDIEKFNRLVVYDKEEEQSLKYKNEIRGKVQNKQVKADPEPSFLITYYEQLSGVDKISHFSNLVTDYNKKHKLALQLIITNKEAALTDDQAEQHFESINENSLTITQNPSDPNGYFIRALDFMVLQDLSEALIDYDRVIALDPEFLLAYFNRAGVRLKLLELSKYGENTKEDIVSELQAKKRTSPVSTSNPYIKQREELQKKENRLNIEYDQIIKDYEMCVKLNPEFVYVYFNKGNIRYIQKDFRMAVTEYNEAIRRHPDFAEAYFNRGLTYLSLGNTEKGIADLSKAGELGLVNAYGIIKRMTVD